MGKIKLFCFPYAGGSAMVYNKWKQYLAPGIELMPIELAGRGRRIHEALYKDIQHLVDDVLSIIGKEITQTSYALFGHSLGGMISYELAVRIRDQRLPPPVHIFFSGKSAPGIKNDKEKIYHRMSDEVFRKEVISLGGTPAEFFEQPELVELLLPMLKNDFRLAETEIYNGDILPFDENITVFLGKDDDFTPEQCDGWKKHTKQHCNIHYFEGGHFFLHNEVPRMASIINMTLDRTVCEEKHLLKY